MRSRALSRVASSDKMHNSLFDLKRALLGEIGMSTELEELANCLFNGFLPGMWSNMAP